MKKLAAILIALLCIYQANIAGAATSCNYPTSHDTWVDAIAGDFFTIAGLNSRTCATEKLETGPLRPNAGSVSAPAFSFRLDPDTGIYSSAANEFTLVTNGVAAGKWTTTGLTLLKGPLDFTLGAVATFGTTDSFGLALKTGGTERGRFDNSGNFEVGVATTTARGRLVSQKSTGVFLHNVINLTNGASTAIENATTLTGASHGRLEVMTPDSVGQYCMFYINGGSNAATILINGGACSVTDAGTTIAVIPDGDGTYTLKNRLGSTYDFNVTWLGL